VQFAHAHFGIAQKHLASLGETKAKLVPRDCLINRQQAPLQVLDDDFQAFEADSNVPVDAVSANEL
jgi:hypothetical protein